jgi:integrase
MRSPSSRRRYLTELEFDNLQPRRTRYEVPDPGARGLYVVVHPTSRKSFCVRYRGHDGQPKKLTLQPGISLAAARKLASDALHEVAQGRDPSATKKQAKADAAAAAINTVQFVSEEFIRREGGKLRTLDARERLLKLHVYPRIGKKLISELKRSEINRMLDDIEDSAGKRTAEFALQYLRRALNWHAVRDDDFRTPIVTGMGRYDQKANARSRVLSDAEIRTIWRVSEETGYFGQLIRFLFLTGARRGEAAGMTWGELEGNLWHLPASRHKTGTALTRPLSKAAMAIVNAQPKLGPYVFTFNGNRPAQFGRGKRAFTKDCALPDWRLHDVRRTARTLLSRAGINADVAERCLGHSLGTIRAIYDRHGFENEMLLAFEALATLLDRIVNPPADADVVTPLRRKA